MADGVTGASPQLSAWLADAGGIGDGLPVALATTGAHGPRVRTVLATALDEGGLGFHSSRPTGKTDDLGVDARASAVVHWPALGRQLVMVGEVRELDAATSDAAYETRPTELQAIAWLHEELAPLADRALLHATYRAVLERDVSVRPPSWGTYLLVPHRIDLWHRGDLAKGRPNEVLRWDRDGDAWASRWVLS